ncbi:WD40 repeat domain-containing protein [Pseudonocardia charpentierae]|uniref:WD40 repeat domain-containing protein n=1 Tax=Pseudonocardia charpentierae TaxID=3075545 RepID=A0ABU2NHF6_9PSEU|nr:WD40 repeat domain-containing protein [Pseudonocardia sp. DSM 45834]MDT0353375.1 WD40 repeat domain-containing protein [Pseudonocardia sp. DSM 45834]
MGDDAAYALFPVALVERTRLNLDARGVTDGYFDRLDGWVETYRAAGWPADTPAYVLSTYLEVAAARDVSRAAALVTDLPLVDLIIGHGTTKTLGSVVRALTRSRPADRQLRDLSRCLDFQRDLLTDRTPGAGLTQLCLQARVFDRPLADRLHAHLRTRSPDALLPLWSGHRVPLEQRWIQPLEHEVQAAAVSADGRRAVVGGTAVRASWREGSVAVVELDADPPVFRPSSIHADADDVAIASDGRWALAVGRNVYRWDLDNLLATEMRAGDVDLDDTPATQVVLAPDGRSALVRGGKGGRYEDDDDGFLLHYDLRDLANEPRRVAGLPGRVMAMAISPDGRSAFLSCRVERGGENVLLDLTGPAPTIARRGDAGRAARCVAFSADGRFVLGDGSAQAFDLFAMIGRYPGQALVRWDLNGAELVSEVLGTASEAIGRIAVSPDGRYALTAGDDPGNGGRAEVLFWDLTATPVRSETWLRPERTVQSISVTADGCRALLACRNFFGTSRLELWDLDPHYTPAPAPPRYAAHRLALSAQNDRMITAGSGRCGGPVHLWDLQNPARPGVRPVEDDGSGSPTDVAISPDGTQAMIVRTESFLFDRSTLVVRELDAGVGTPQAHEMGDGVAAVAPGPGGTLWACSTSSWGGGGSLERWDLKTDPPSVTRHAAPRPMKAIAVTADGRHAFTPCGYGDVLWWDLEPAEPVHRAVPWPGSSDAEMESVAISADGRTALTGGSGERDRGLVLAWDLTGDVPVPRPVGEVEHAVGGVALDPDGRRGVTVGGQKFPHDGPGEIVRWDVVSGQRLATLSLDGPQTAVRILRRSGAGLLVVAGGPSGVTILEADAPAGDWSSLGEG